jgi:hypothetical protein
VLTQWTEHLDRLVTMLSKRGHDPVVLRGRHGRQGPSSGPRPARPSVGRTATARRRHRPLRRRGSRLPRARHALPRRTRRLQGPTRAAPRPHPSRVPRQGHRRGARPPRRRDRRPRLIAGRTRTRLHSLGSPDPRRLARQ